MNIFREEVDDRQYIIAYYYLETKTNIRDAAWNLAIGQSVGNPNVRNRWETDELFDKHACLILGNENVLKHTEYKGNVRIAFPIANINLKEDGISQLLCHLMGGQMDIANITKCHLLKLQFPEHLRIFNSPKYGINGIRKFTGTYDRPILGGIVKPKIGIEPKTLLAMVKEMVEGGVNFIKEDEIMSNPSICPLEVRVPLIANYLKDKNVIYAVCINSDPPYLLERVKTVHKLGGNAVHVNFWSGLGAYKAIRDLDLDLFLFFQKSGDRILTDPSHSYRISWTVICQLAGMMGVDFIHAGMWGGYMDQDENSLREVLDLLHNFNVLPSLSCGMHPGLIEATNKKFGIDYLANVGGALHGHPQGTLAGVKAMRQAIDNNHQEEYHEAIKLWGKFS